MLEESVVYGTSDAAKASAATIQRQARSPAPPVVIKPSDRWARLNLREIWVARELLYFLIWRDLKVRYKQTILGVAWVILQPLIMTIIFTVFLGMLVRVPSSGIPYPLLAYTGLTTWAFLSNAIIQSGNSLVGNTTLITKIYFPRAIIPVAAVGARLVDFCMASVILVGLLFYYQITPSVHLLMFPVCILLTTVIALGFGCLSAAINVRYRDVGIILPVALQLWMFVSPVVYSMNLVPVRWLWLYRMNPMTGALEGVRSSLLNQAFDWVGLSISAVIGVTVLVYSIFIFKRMERHFADMV